MHPFSKRCIKNKWVNRVVIVKSVPLGIEMVLNLIIGDDNVIKRILKCFELFHGEGLNHIETRSLICSANQWTGFCMIGTFVMKEFSKHSK